MNNAKEILELISNSITDDKRTADELSLRGLLGLRVKTEIIPAFDIGTATYTSPFFHTYDPDAKAIKTFVQDCLFKSRDLLSFTLGTKALEATYPQIVKELYRRLEEASSDKALIKKMLTAGHRKNNYEDDKDSDYQLIVYKSFGTQMDHVTIRISMYYIKDKTDDIFERELERELDSDPDWIEEEYEREEREDREMEL